MYTVCCEAMNFCSVIFRLVLFVSFNNYSSLCTVQGATSIKPHVIFILADDLGWDDVSFHGSSQIPTPNIDALANAGVILNNYYVSPICTPTRSAIMTGKYSIHTGMQHGVILAAEPYGLGLDHTLLPQHLKTLGYSTHGVGKWHLGFFEYAYTPIRRGFDTFFGFWCGKSDYWNHSNEVGLYGLGLDLHNGTQPVWTEKGHYSTEVFTTKSVNIIQAHRPSTPLFLYLAHQAVHTANTNQPLQAPVRLIKKFSYIKDVRRRIYAAMVSALDESVKKVVDALKTKNMYNNSIIVFSTDNGGPAAGYNLNMASNYPLRGMKNTLWEGGVRGAAFVHSPLLASPGRVSMDLMHVTDWLPTLYAQGGGDVHDLQNVDGYDLWNTISTGKTSPRAEVLHNIDPMTGKAALRLQHWKLVVNTSASRSGWYPPPSYAHAQNSPQRLLTLKNAVIHCTKPPAHPSTCAFADGPCLFDVEQDPCEHKNVAAHETEVVVTMLKKLEDYKRGMITPRNKPSDVRANPAWHGGVWTAWRG